jgi:hypothetical protein
VEQQRFFVLHQEMIEGKIDLRVENTDSIYVGSDFDDLRHNTLRAEKNRTV